MPTFFPVQVATKGKDDIGRYFLVRLRFLRKSSVFMNETRYFEIHIILTELAFHCRCKILPLVVSVEGKPKSK